MNDQTASHELLFQCGYNFSGGEMVPRKQSLITIRRHAVKEGSLDFF